MHNLAVSNPVLRIFYFDMLKTFIVCVGSWIGLMFLFLYSTNVSFLYMAMTSCVWLSYICWKQFVTILVSTFGNGASIGFDCAGDPAIAEKMKKKEEE